MLEYAIENGVNYFDTAYVYHGGKSESFIGGVLKPYRDKIHIATKCPTWEVKCEEDFDRLLNEQLERLQTDYIDFYLMHALDKDRFKKVVEKFNLIDQAQTRRKPTAKSVISVFRSMMTLNIKKDY